MLQYLKNFPTLLKLRKTNFTQLIPSENHLWHSHNRWLLNISVFLTNLHKCHFTLAVIAVDIFNGHLSVVFDPACTAQDVMNAGCHFIPFVVVPKPGKCTHAHVKHTSGHKHSIQVKQLIHMQTYITIQEANKQRTYAGSVTWVVPMGTISMDLPQNLFFHRTSKRGSQNNRSVLMNMKITISS